MELRSSYYELPVGLFGRFSSLAMEKMELLELMRGARYGINIIANKGWGVKRRQTSRFKETAWPAFASLPYP
jgi:hypothetical protein